MAHAAGAVVGSASYDPFGGVLSQPGFTSPWGFAGEYHDPLAGLQYLRARWYQPGVGRFTQGDPFPGVLALPLTQHPYVYGLNSPTRYTDPGGEFVAEAFVGAVLIGAATGAMIGAIGYTAAFHDQQFRATDMLIAAGIGATSGALVAASFVTGSGIPGLAALSGLLSMGAQYLSTGQWDWGCMAGAYAGGVVSALVFSMLPAGVGFGGTLLMGGSANMVGELAKRVVWQSMYGNTSFGWRDALSSFAWGAVFAGAAKVIVPALLKPFQKMAVELFDQQVFAEIYTKFLLKGGLPASSQTARAAQTLLNSITQRSQSGQTFFKAIFVISKPAETIFFNSDLGQALLGKLLPVPIQP